MWKRAFAVLLAVTFPAYSHGQEGKRQEGDLQHHEITVTATRLETPLREVAGSITVITREELVRTRKTSLVEAIRESIGLAVLQNGGIGGAASVSIRGSNSEHTLVLIDGLELNDPINPSRSYDLANFPLNQVERVEILRGPQSLLYGSNAIGGVINIITRKGQGRARVDLTTMAGSFGTLAGNAGMTGSSGRVGYSLGGSFFRTEGVSAAATIYPGNSERDGYRNFSLAGKIGYSTGTNSSLDIIFRSIGSRTDIDNFGGPFGDDPNNVQDYVAILGQGRFRSFSPGRRWEQIVAVSLAGTRRNLSNPSDGAHPGEVEEGTYRSTFFKVDWQNNFYLHPSNTLTGGVEIEQESGRSEYVSSGPWGAAESLLPVVRASSLGFYVQDKWDFRQKFFLTAGIRGDTNNRSGPALTFRVAPAFLLEETATRIRATAGTGFKSPSLYQLFAPGTAWGPIGNPDLRPERSFGWDVGVDQTFMEGRLSVGLTWFANTFRNLIDFDFALGYVNIGRSGTKGLESALRLNLFPGTDFRASYTRLNARDNTTGESLLRRPRDKFSADVHSRFWGRLDLTLSLLHIGNRFDRDFSSIPYETVSLPGYTILDAVVSFALDRSWEMTLRLNNIFDTKYQPVWGYGAPGFALNAGIRIAL